MSLGRLKHKENLMLEISQFKNDSKGYFAAMDEGKEAGRITYTFVGRTKLILDHTEVNPDYRGKSIGNKILMFIVEYARMNNIKIIPICPFAKSVFDSTKSIRDVLV
jgi:predicted GNAT family acetyltransferase